MSPIKSVISKFELKEMSDAAKTTSRPNKRQKAAQKATTAEEELPLTEDEKLQVAIGLNPR